MSKSCLEEWTGRSGPGKEVGQSFPDIACPGHQGTYSRQSRGGSRCLGAGEDDVGVAGRLWKEGWQRHEGGGGGTGLVVSGLIKGCTGSH